jgi:1-deoxy-D-xylulose-5-phosphate reductoisomerase
LKRIFIVGSTGSLGIEALEVVKLLGENYKVIGLSGFKNYKVLSEQISVFSPLYAGSSAEVLEKLKGEFSNVHLFEVEKDLEKILEEASPDLTLFLSSKITSLRSIYNLVSHKHLVGIANKESIIAGGEFLFDSERRKYIIPIDSEPSAIFQCLRGEDISEVKTLILTASGGPFIDRDTSTFNSIKKEDALKHPKWKMGNKITIDSSTLINKAFEVIEAHFLFDMLYEKIKVLIHKESIIHSIVEFQDGNIKALLGIPKMHFPLQYAITYPHRVFTGLESLDLSISKSLTFERMDVSKFPGFEIVLKYGKQGGNFLPLLVAVDEVLVESFLNDRIKYTDLYTYMEEILQKFTFERTVSIDEVWEFYNLGIITADKFLRRSL